MKAAVSIPDSLFADAERMASRFNTSRSQLYARALAEFIARHDDDLVTETLNQVHNHLEASQEKFVTKAGVDLLKKTEW